MESGMTTDRIGQRLGNYTIIQLLGQGGFAEVYLGEHIYLKSQAAVKVLQARLAGSDDTDSFLKEAQTIAKLFHPHIIRIMDFGIEAETPYLVMDYAPKGTLRQKHPRGTPIPLPIIIPYVKQVADALQYAHNELRLIHRDIKPENMLIGRRDEILLSDFGIALVAQSSRYQGTQDVIGTVAYMAPEQIQGKPHAASDQYALAVVVYEWLTGDRPFHGSFTEMCTQHIFASPTPLSTKAPSLPPDIDLVILQAMAKDPHQRFENIQAFADALEQVSQHRRGQQTEAMPPTIYSFLTEAAPNNTPDLAHSPAWTPPSPSNTPSQPAPSWSQQPAYSPTLPAQPPQPKVVLPSPPAYTPQHPATNNAQSSPAPTAYGPGSAPQHNQFSPRPDTFQPANQNQSSSAYAPRPAQQQAMAPQQPTPATAIGQRYGNNPQAAQGQAAPPQPEPTDAGVDEGLGILAPLMRPTITTIIGIFLFCIASLFHPLVLGRPLLLVLAVPLIFGAAFGPIIGLLVGLGGVFCLNLITPSPILPLEIDYLFVREHLFSLHVIRSWWNPLFINGLIGALAGLSMLRKRRFPNIGSATRGTILGALALFGSIGFVFYNQFGLNVLLRSAFNISIVGIANILLAFALLVIYSILGRLLDPGA
jgi:serine/threonine protein kinase